MGAKDLLIASSGEIFYEWSTATGQLTWRGSSQALLGCPTERLEATRQAWLARVHPDDLGAVEGAQSGPSRAYQIEYRLRDEDGDYRRVEERGAFTLDEAGRPDHVVGVIAEKGDTDDRPGALLKDLHGFRRFADAVPFIVWTATSEGAVNYSNRSFSEYTGIPDTEPPASRWQPTLHPDDIARCLAVWMDCVSSGRSYDIEYRLKGRDGQFRWFHVRAVPIRDGSGRIVSWYGTANDIQHTKRLEGEERRAAQLADLLDKAQDAILVRDLEGRLTYMNRRAEQLYGWERSFALGKDVRAMQFSRNAERFDAICGVVLRRGFWSGEIEQVSREGQAIVVEARWTLLTNPDGTPQGMLAINTDISERKRLEQQLLRAQRFESLGTLTGGIVHDLNNVLTPVLTSVGFLQDSETSAEKLEDLKILEAAALRGAEMVRQLLLLARGDSLSAVGVDMSKIAKEVLRLASETFPKTIKLSLDSPREPWMIRGYPIQLYQLLMNLCVNARDAMAGSGSLAISIEHVQLDQGHPAAEADTPPGPYVLVNVSDTGTGIPPELQTRIFDPFFTTKEPGRGTGLGLASSLAIVRGHGGLLRLRSEPGKGSCFSIYLPAHAHASRLSDGDLARSALPRGQGQLILIVDDEEPIRRTSARTLGQYGYQTLTAANGAEATALFAERRGAVAAVLLDMSMPIMDGPATAAALKALQPDVKILGTSGSDTAQSLAWASQLDGPHFLQKPYTTEALLGALRRLLG